MTNSEKKLLYQLIDFANELTFVVASRQSGIYTQEERYRLNRYRITIGRAKSHENLSLVAEYCEALLACFNSRGHGGVEKVEFILGGIGFLRESLKFLLDNRKGDDKN